MNLEQKTKRIINKTLINLSKLFAFVGAIGILMWSSLWLSYELSGDFFFGIAGMFIPLIIFSVWDMSKNQVEAEIYKEEGTISALSRKYE